MNGKINWVNWKILEVKEAMPYQKASEDNKLHISILPNEILLIIFNHFKLDHLKEFRDFYAIARTCRLWYVLQTKKLAFFEDRILKKAVIKTIQSSPSDNCKDMGIPWYYREVGIPRYVSRQGVYLQFRDGDFAFYNKDGKEKARFALTREYYFFDQGILRLSDEKIQLLQPDTAKVKDTLTLPKGKGPASFHVDPTGQSLLVHYQNDKSIYFCDFNAAPISAKEIQVEKKENFSFDNLKFDGTSLLLLHRPYFSYGGSITLQFSFWQLKHEILSPSLSQIGHCDFNLLTCVERFYLHNKHVVATTASRLYSHDFETQAQRSDSIEKIAPGETIDQLCCAGETSSVFSTYAYSPLNSCEEEYHSAKIYLWKHNSGEIKLIRTLEDSGPIVHMHLIGKQIIAASGRSILIVDRESGDLSYKYEGEKAWSISPSQANGRADQLAVKLAKRPEEADQQKEEAVVLLFDFLPEREKKQESTT
jgi:hypothetical protein